MTFFFHLMTFFLPRFFFLAQVDRGGVACRVTKVEYELPARGDTFEPPTVAAVATLVATGPQASAVGGGQPHEVSLRPSDCAEFLVPKRKVMKVRWLNRGAGLPLPGGRGLGCGGASQYCRIYVSPCPVGEGEGA